MQFHAVANWITPGPCPSRLYSAADEQSRTFAALALRPNQKSKPKSLAKISNFRAGQLPSLLNSGWGAWLTVQGVPYSAVPV
jgi:hypothetical protein